MKTKFRLFDVVKIKSKESYTGKIIMVETYGGKLQGTSRYLLDCFPGALSGYVYYKHPSGYGQHCEVEANWFDESEIELTKDQDGCQ